jgi:hypothetical protein
MESTFWDQISDWVLNFLNNILTEFLTKLFAWLPDLFQTPVV